MSTMITVTKDDNDDFKTVILVCFDRLNKKYRSINYIERTIAPQLYDSPEDIINSLQALKERGRIKDFEVIKRKS